MQVAERGRADARVRRAEAARRRRGDRLAGGARPCSGSSTSTRLRSSARSARCSSTREDQEVVRAAGLEALVGGRGEATSAEPRSPSRRSSSTCRALAARSAGACTRPACRSPPSARLRSRRRCAGAADQPPAAVLDGPRGARLRPVAGQGVRLGVLRGVRHRPRCRDATRCSTTLQTVPSPRRRAAADSDRRADRVGRGARSGAAGSTRAAAATASEEPRAEVALPMRASDEEVLRDKRFDALEPDELAALYRVMAQLRVATPLRRTRRARRDRHGERIDLRRTLRDSMRTGGDPIRLARRRRRVVRRRTGAAVRHLGLDGALRARVSAVPDLAPAAASAGARSGPRRSCSRPG